MQTNQTLFRGEDRRRPKENAQYDLDEIAQAPIKEYIVGMSKRARDRFVDLYGEKEC